jgi:hypothetical protein
MGSVFNAAMNAPMANPMKPGKAPMTKVQRLRFVAGTTCTCAPLVGWNFRSFRSSAMEPAEASAISRSADLSGKATSRLRWPRSAQSTACVTLTSMAIASTSRNCGFGRSTVLDPGAHRMLDTTGGLCAQSAGPGSSPGGRLLPPVGKPTFGTHANTGATGHALPFVPVGHTCSPTETTLDLHQDGPKAFIQGVELVIRSFAKRATSRKRAKREPLSEVARRLFLIFARLSWI